MRYNKNDMWNHPFICVLNTVAVRGVCLITLPALSITRALSLIKMTMLLFFSPEIQTVFSAVYSVLLQCQWGCQVCMSKRQSRFSAYMFCWYCIFPQAESESFPVLFCNEVYSVRFLTKCQNSHFPSVSPLYIIIP